MEKVRLEVEFVTPCFLGGADPTAAPEWNGKAVRGQLRWWFRAVAGGYFAGKVAEGELLRVVSAAEQRLFGTTSSRSPLMVRTGPRPDHCRDASRFGSRLNAEEIAREWGAANPSTVTDRLRIRGRNRYTRRIEEIPTNPVQYLAFGPFSKGRLHRPYIRPEQSSHLDLWFSRCPPLSGELCSLFQLALWAWLNLGGLGARWRKGFGSLRAGVTPAQETPWLPARLRAANRREFESAASHLLRAAGGGVASSQLPEPTWSRFSPGARIFIADRPCRSWGQALQTLGCWLIGFRRRYGHDTKEERADRQGRDYTWVYGPQPPGSIADVPDRAGFGLPLGFRNRTPPPQTRFVEPASPRSSRRASPLLLHVAQFDSGYYPVLTHLPALLAPTDGELQIDLETTTLHSPPTRHQKSIVADFLDDLADKRLIQPIATEEAA